LPKIIDYGGREQSNGRRSGIGRRTAHESECGENQETNDEAPGFGDCPMQRHGLGSAGAVLTGDDVHIVSLLFDDMLGPGR
jgi:hypothetical protein